MSDDHNFNDPDVHIFNLCFVPSTNSYFQTINNKKKPKVLQKFSIQYRPNYRSQMLT